MTAKKQPEQALDDAAKALTEKIGNYNKTAAKQWVLLSQCSCG